jgi:hypothetical protein
LKFRARYEVFEHYGGCIGHHKASLKAVSDTNLSDNERATKSREKTLAHLFSRHADPKRFDTLLTDLDNQYICVAITSFQSHYKMRTQFYLSTRSQSRTRIGVTIQTNTPFRDPIQRQQTRPSKPLKAME